MEIEKILLVSIVAALLELDSFYIGMTLLSQPVIAGFLTGYILGDIYTGLLIGTIIQLIWLNTPIVGAYVPPSSTAISVVSTGLSILIFYYIDDDFFRNSLYMFCMIIGVGVGYFIGQMDIWNRKLNTKIIYIFENKILNGHINYLFLIKFLSILIKFLRDFLFFILIFLGGTVITARIFITLPDEVMRGLKIAFWLMPALGFSVVFEMFRTKEGSKFHGIFLLLSYFLMMFYKVRVLFFLIAIFIISIFVVYNTVWRKKEVEK